MTLQPPGAHQQPRPGPPPAGYARLRIPRPDRDAESGFRVNQTPVAPMRELTAPTLLQFWRSDSRVVPGRRPPKWAGRTAFFVGLLSAVLFLVGTVVSAALLVALASPFAVVAIFFALIALIAGIGRGLGIVGLVFALAGSTLFWAWVGSLLG